MSKPELYISIDIETDGQAPGVNSMLALGAAAYTISGTLLDTWYEKMHPMEGARENPDTMEWWKTQPEAWEEVKKGRINPAVATGSFVSWCDRLGRNTKLVASAWPAGFDYPFIQYYTWKFANRNPLGFACLDMRSYANGMYGCPGYYDTRKYVPEENLYKLHNIRTDDLRPHFAVDDAIRQGRLLVAMLQRQVAVNEKAEELSNDS